MASKVTEFVKNAVAELKHCVVCGMGSHRDDWQGKDNVACDGHTKDEVAAAIKDKEAKAAEEAKAKLEASKTQTPAPPSASAVNTQSPSDTGQATGAPIPDSK